MRERGARDGAAHASILRLDRFTVLDTRDSQNVGGVLGDDVSGCHISCNGARAGGTERGSMIGLILIS